MLTGEGAGIAGESVEAIGNDKRLGAALSGLCRSVQNPDGLLLGVDVFPADFQVFRVVCPQAKVLHYLIRALSTAEHSGGTLPYPDGIADAMAASAKNLCPLSEEVLVREEAGADIDAVDSVDANLRSRYGLEILAFGDYCADNSGAIRIGNSLYKRVPGEYGDAQPANAVGLHWETALSGHGLDNGLYPCSGLHGLVRSQIADISGAHSEDILAQKGELRIHHALDNGGGVDARKVIVLEGGHERKSAGCDHKDIGIHKEDFSRRYILESQTLTFQDIPNHGVQEYAFRAVAGKGICNVKAAHSAVVAFLLKEEELVRLHAELAAYGRVCVNYKVVYTGFTEFLTYCKAGGTCANDCYSGFVDFAGLLLCHSERSRRIFRRKRGLLNAPYLLDIVNLCYTDAVHTAVYQHFTGTALAYSAFHGTAAAFKTMMMDGKAGLMQGCGNCLSFLPCHGLSFKQESMKILCRDLQNGVACNLVHYLWLSVLQKYKKRAIFES